MWYYIGYWVVAIILALALDRWLDRNGKNSLAPILMLAWPVVLLLFLLLLIPSRRRAS